MKPLTNLDRYRGDLEKLITLGSEMHFDLMIQEREKKGKLDKRLEEIKQKVRGSFNQKYQKWYTESFSVIRQLVPARLSEFEALYKADPKRKNIDSISYTIQDWLMGVRAAPNKYTGEFAL